MVELHTYILITFPVTFPELEFLTAHKAWENPFIRGGQQKLGFPR